MPQPGTNKSLVLVAVFNSGTMKAAEEHARANQLFDWPLALLLGLLFIIVPMHQAAQTVSIIRGTRSFF
ncbi:MAG: hypothetical protein QOH96_3339 [Blastocatellia bacterium]|jgi:hypothetical protein|nr:hypothetical protein [Blastocatellia bacterium]